MAKWTVDELRHAFDAGRFGFDARIELIDGEVIMKTPASPGRCFGIQATAQALRAIIPPTHHVRTQAPLVFQPHSIPEPAITVVSGNIRDYKHDHPTTAALVVEVSDSALRRDQITKAAIYARAGIAEYWIVNLVDRVLEVHRDPGPLSGQPLEYHYHSITRFDETGACAPLVAPESAVSVADLLP